MDPASKGRKGHRKGMNGRDVHEVEGKSRAEKE